MIKYPGLKIVKNTFFLLQQERMYFSDLLFMCY